LSPVANSIIQYTEKGKKRNREKKTNQCEWDRGGEREQERKDKQIEGRELFIERN